MVLSIWQRRIVDDAGNVLAGASVEVRLEATGNLAALKSDRAGSSGISNPTTADANGFVEFYVAGGAYQIVATSGLLSKTWRFVALGTAQELDIDYLGHATTGGSGDAYTLTVPGMQEALADGQLVSFTASFSNGADSTLTVTNGNEVTFPTKSIRQDGDTRLFTFSIQENGHYTARYDSAADGESGAWMLLNPGRRVIAGNFFVIPDPLTNNQFVFDVGTGGAGTSITGYCQPGTVASPTAVIAGQEIGFIQYFPWDGASFSGTGVGPLALVAVATQNHTPSHRGAGWLFQSIHNDSTDGQNEIFIQDGLTALAAGQFGAPGKGLGTLWGKNGVYAGAAGSIVGKLVLENATSGSITLAPPAGALGTVTLTVPAATDTLVGKATTDTLTNKTFDSSGTGNTLQISGVTVSGGQLPGTATNDSATAGNIGEYLATAGATNNNANATVTMTIAAPCVVTWTAHNFTVGAATTAVKFTNSGGALPTGIVSGTTYYLKAIDANTFNIATSAANALAGTFITTTGSQSGTHTADIRVSMASNTRQDIAAITLAAGDWDVSGQMLKGAGASTTVTYLAGNLATASITVDRTFGRRLSFQYGGLVLGNIEFTVLNFAPSRFSLSVPTTIFLVADDVFGTSTMTCSGWLRARRVR